MPDAAGVRPYQESNGDNQFPSPAVTDSEKAGLLGNTRSDLIPYDDQADLVSTPDNSHLLPERPTETTGLSLSPEAVIETTTREQRTGGRIVASVGGMFKRSAKSSARSSGASIVSKEEELPVTQEESHVILGSQSHRRSLQTIVQTRKQIHDAKFEFEKFRRELSQPYDTAAIKNALELRQMASDGWKYYEQTVLERAEHDRQEAERMRLEAVRQLNDHDKEVSGQLFRTFHNELRAPDIISSTQLPGTRTGEYLGRYYDATRAARAGAALNMGEVVPGKGLSLVPEMGEQIAVDGEWHTPEDRRQFVGRIFDTVAQTYTSYPDVLESDEPSDHKQFLAHISDTTREITGRASGEAAKTYYRLGTSTSEGHARAAFEEAIEVIELNADEWEVGRDGQGEEALYFNDGVYAVLDNNQKVHLFRNPKIRGLSKLIDNSAIGKFHNVQPGLSVEGWIKTPKHPEGGGAMLATYDSDRIIPATKDVPVQVIMKTRIRPVALTSEGLTVAQAASHAIRNEQSGVDPVINPLIEAERGNEARLQKYFNMAQFSQDYIEKAAEAENQLPERPSRISEEADILALLNSYRTEITYGSQSHQVHSNGSQLDARTIRPRLESGQTE